jgi:hypothetical protein
MRGRVANRPPRGAISLPQFRVRGAETEIRRFGKRRFGLGLLASIFLIALFDWFSAGTQRLYVDEDSAASQQQGTVWQHFAVRGHQVVPQIISDQEARFTFPISLPSRHRLQFTAHPEGPATYEIFLRVDSAERKIASGRIEEPQSASVSLPSGRADLKFVVHGRIAWFDLRLTRQFQWPIYVGLFALVVFVSHPAARLSRQAGNWLALGASTLLCLGLLEWLLGMLALKLPPAIQTARHDLGFVASDPRWMESPRYLQRLRPNLKTYCEWEYGDIVRMGAIAPELLGAERHRYPFETDAEGFRNAAVRDQIDVAALGDSFVDAMTSPAEEAWPARLEQISGKKVQNYGTSSFGPQQELYVLEDYALRHQPRDVVLGFFAGNDFFDAERFDNWEKRRTAPGEEQNGWRLGKKYRRYETLYLTTLARVALAALAPQKKPAPSAVAMPVSSRFYRGLYQIPAAGGGLLRFAFMPPYLQKLASSRPELERSRGWELIRASILRMREGCAKQGSRFTVMFIPSKAEVYWPLVERSLGPEELQRALDFCSSYNHMPLRAADIRANRLAQNDLLREFCAKEAIPFLDLTSALEQSAAAGRAVYFADDAHWNAAGHEIAAQELAKFLAREP